jgi:hypothetical protein
MQLMQETKPFLALIASVPGYKKSVRFPAFLTAENGVKGDDSPGSRQLRVQVQVTRSTLGHVE